MRHDPRRQQPFGQQLLVSLRHGNRALTQAGWQDQFANTVIGTTEKLDDEAAKKMTKVLYAALGNGKSIDKAYAEAIEIVKETGFEDVYMTDRAEGQDEPELTFTPGDVEIDPENEDKWDRHFFERYLEEQINSLTDSVKLNRQILFALLGLIMKACCCLMETE